MEEERSKAKKVANVLLDYHATFVWIASTATAPDPHTGCKRGRESQRSDASATKRHRLKAPTDLTSSLQVALTNDSPQPNTETAPHSDDAVSALILEPVVQFASVQTHPSFLWRTLGSNGNGIAFQETSAALPPDSPHLDLETRSTLSGENQAHFPLQTLVSTDCSVQNSLMIPGSEAGLSEGGLNMQL